MRSAELLTGSNSVDLSAYTEVCKTQRLDLSYTYKAPAVEAPGFLTVELQLKFSINVEPQNLLIRYWFAQIPGYLTTNYVLQHFFCWQNEVFVAGIGSRVCVFEPEREIPVQITIEPDGKVTVFCEVENLDNDTWKPTFSTSGTMQVAPRDATSFDEFVMKSVDELEPIRITKMELLATEMK
jgi:hypothetical protein